MQTMNARGIAVCSTHGDIRKFESPILYVYRPGQATTWHHPLPLLLVKLDGVTVARRTCEGTRRDKCQEN